MQLKRPIFLFFLLLCFTCFSQKKSFQKKTANITILFTTSHPANRFIPSKSFGAAFDGHAHGDIDRILTPYNIKAMKSVGLKPVSYRLRSELAGEVWHWNPEGHWSEETKKQGYWVSDSVTKDPIRVSYGFRLPRRGNTHDQANDDGYSRIDDNDTLSFWKSNPYLDSNFTHESNRQHPQWVIIDFGENKEVNALKILWGFPYALNYSVEYAFDIGKDYFEPYMPGLWHHFPIKDILNPIGDNKVHMLKKGKPLSVRFIKITMTESTPVSLTGSDIRDKLGFSIRELEAGTLDEKGRFTDLIRHSPVNKLQTVIRVSSTDPWHRAGDIDLNTEQAGIDRFFNCGLISGPVLMPIALLYDTPDNMISFLKYIKNHHYQVEELDMGEEPEGQLVNPVDYGTLYLQWAELINNIGINIKMGGPSFAALAFTREDNFTFTERQWTIQFLDYLKAHHRLHFFNFFSTEWYPFDNICVPTAPQLAIAPQMLAIALDDFKKTILPPEVPIYITEYGYSAYGGRPEVEIEGALMYADILGKFMSLGGTKSFLYGYEPTFLDQTGDCDWGNNMLFGMDDSGHIIYHTAAYYGMQMLTQYWATPPDSILEVYPVSVNIFNSVHQPLISAYALLRGGNKWSVALINKDPLTTYHINLDILNTTTNAGTHVKFPLKLIQYSKSRYHWKNEAGEGHPSLELPPVKKSIKSASELVIPPYSLSVISE